MKNIKLLRGMHDIYIPNIYEWQYLENIIKNIFISYGYNEVRFPILENTKLFKNIIGNNTDLVNKEMYSFYDKNKKSITLRPEGTSSCARIIIEHNLFKNNELLKFWYYGPMFRYERPQQGRYRQFYQFGAEIYGLYDSEIDLEIILMINRLWKKLGIINDIYLELNNIGNLNSRLKYNNVLINFIKNKKILNIDNISLIKKLINNPFKIFDKKNNKDNFKKMLNDAPKLTDYIDEFSKKKFNELCNMLNILNIKYKINNYLVRGLNYYNGTVFEWKTKKLLSKNTICGGGRYEIYINNNLSKQKKTLIPAIGFSIGMERLILLINKIKPYTIYKNDNLNHIIIIIDNKNFIFRIKAFKLIEDIKNNINNIKITILYYKKRLKQHLSFANKINAHLALILQSNEIKNKIIIIKNLKNKNQYIIPQSILINTLINILKFNF